MQTMWYAQKVWDMFETKNQGENHDLYVLSDKLLLADVFEIFRDQCIEIFRDQCIDLILLIFCQHQD